MDVDVEGATGGSDSDVLVGNGGNGSFSGGDGDDRIDPGAGADSVCGRRRLRRGLIRDGAAGAVTVDLGTPGGDGEAGENDDVAADVEQVTGGGGDDRLTGTGSANTLVGGGGKDRLSGGDGLDLLNGGRATTCSTADSGEDALFGGGGADALDGGAGGRLDRRRRGRRPGGLLARREAVTVTLDGEPDDGAQGEATGSRRTWKASPAGAGADRLDTRDGAAGDVSCGPAATARWRTPPIAWTPRAKR